MPKIPRLPAALVAVLGVIASVLAVVQPSLPQPWPAIVGGLLALLTLVGVPVTLRTIRAHGRAAYAHRVHQEAARPSAGTWRRDDGISRVAVLAATAVTLLLVASAVVVAMSPAEASPGRGPGRPSFAAVTVVPEILSGAFGCSSGAAVLAVRAIAPTSPGSSTWSVRQGATGIRVQVWTGGTWRDVATTVTSSGLLSAQTYYRWRPILGGTIGPDYFLGGDLCAAWPDDVAAAAGTGVAA